MVLLLQHMFHHSDRCKINETIYLFSTQDGTLLPLLWIWITRLKSLIISILSFSAGQTRYKISMFVFERYVRNCIIISGTKGRTSVKIKTCKHIKSSPNFVQQEVCIKVSFTELNVSMKVIQGGKSMTQIVAHYWLQCLQHPRSSLWTLMTMLYSISRALSRRPS